MLVLSQKPYMPNVKISEAASYPLAADQFDHDEIARALTNVGLPNILPQQLREKQVALGTLSGGEMQRFALARALLVKPDWLFLDEATSALDKASETMLLNLLRRDLPDTTIVILTHRQPGSIKIDRIIDLETSGVADIRPNNTIPQTA